MIQQLLENSPKMSYRCKISIKKFPLIMNGMSINWSKDC